MMEKLKQVPRVLFLLLILCELCFGVNILFYTGISSPSHKAVLWPLATKLAESGHKVTFLSPFEAKEKHKNIAEVIPSYYIELTNEDLGMDVFGTKLHGNSSNIALLVPEFAVMSCEAILKSPETAILFDPNTKFDLLVIDAMFSDCALGLVHLYKSPFIYFSTTGFYSWLTYPTAQPNPSPWTMETYIPFFDLTSTYDRVANSIMAMYWGYKRTYEVFPGIQNAFKKYVNMSIPDLRTIDREVSLTFINIHPALTLPQPFLPDVIYTGGIHYTKIKPLPKDIDEFLSGSGDAGSILFSLGSIVQSAHMPNETVQNLLNVFSKLPQRILWKWEDEITLRNLLPSNVMIKKWLPQKDILAHPKIRGFITHGGMLGTIEAIYSAVPMIVVPFYSDQESNAILAQNRGYGLKLEAFQLHDFDLVYNALKDITTNPKYRENALERSRLLLDELESPLERAFYWTEFVLRHNGAKHLRSHARDLPIYAFYHLDAIALAFGAVLIFIIIIRKLVLAVFHSGEPQKHNKRKTE